MMNGDPLQPFVPTILALCQGDPQKIRRLMAMAITAASHPPPPPNTCPCTLTYADLAKAINARNPGTKRRKGKIIATTREETLIKLNIFSYLDDKGLGGGVGYQTGLRGKTKTMFSPAAVEMISTHYQALVDYGWR